VVSVYNIGILNRYSRVIHDWPLRLIHELIYLDWRHMLNHALNQSTLIRLHRAESGHH